MVCDSANKKNKKKTPWRVYIYINRYSIFLIFHKFKDIIYKVETKIWDKY